MKSLYKERYEKLKASGMFWEFYPQLCGTWDIDKKVFIKKEKYLDKHIRRRSDGNKSENTE